MTETKTDKSPGRRALAAVFLRDSANQGMSWRSRTDCAFNAVYLFALAALGTQADNYKHPAADALSAAAEKLGLTPVEIAPALTYLTHRYDPVMHSRIYRPFGPRLHASEAPDQYIYYVLISIAEKLGHKNDFCS
jgi:hypothetical protein